MTEQTPATADVAPESETVLPTGTVATDTTEQVAESDEQKNEREVTESRERSEKRLRGVEKRIHELTTDKYAERARAERAEREREQLLAQLYQRQQAQPQAQGPQRDQYADYESYIEAKAEWKAEQKAQAAVEQALKQVEHRTQSTAQQQQAVQVRQQFESQMSEFAKTVADWDDVVANNEDINIPNEAAALLHAMPDGAQVLYAIGKNPALVKQLKGSAIQQAMALGKISAALKATPQVSKAPAPGVPVGARGAPSGGLSDTESVDDWIRKRNSQINKGR